MLNYEVATQTRCNVTTTIPTLPLRATLTAYICLNMNTYRMALKAQEAEAVTIVGYGNSKNKWNGYAEVELCTHEAPAEVPEVETSTSDTETDAEATIEFTELPFPADRKGFNVVNQWVHLGTTP